MYSQDMGEVVQNLERAEKAFDDLSELVDGPEGFDLSKGAWRRNGWRELDDLRRKLENLKAGGLHVGTLSFVFIFIHFIHGAGFRLPSAL